MSITIIQYVCYFQVVTGVHNYDPLRHQNQHKVLVDYGLRGIPGNPPYTQGPRLAVPERDLPENQAPRSIASPPAPSTSQGRVREIVSDRSYLSSNSPSTSRVCDVTNVVESRVSSQVEQVQVPVPLKFLKIGHKICKTCFKSFKKPYDFEIHSQGAKCFDLPCNIVHPNDHTQFLRSLAFRTSEDAYTYLKINYLQNTKLFLYKPKTNDYQCAATNCNAKLRIRKTTRFIQNEGSLDVYAILGCQQHSHAQFVKLPNICNNGKHVHQIIEASFANYMEAEAYVETLYKKCSPPKYEKNGKKATFICRGSFDCNAEIHVSFNDGKEGPTTIRGCVSHTHIDGEVDIACKVDHDHDPLAIKFQSPKAARDYIYCHELDAVFIIRDSSKNETTDYARYICTTRGHRNAKKTTRKFSDCPAGFTLYAKKQKDGTVDVTLKGCLQHETHEVEARHTRLSAKRKDLIDGEILLQKPIDTILQNMQKLNDQTGKDIIRDDIRRRIRKAAPKPETINQPETDALMAMVRRDDIIKFNFRHFIEDIEQHLSDQEQQKYVQTPDNRFFLMKMTQRQRQLFRANPYTLECDGTHKLDRHDFTTINMAVFDERGEGKLICHAIIPTERTDMLEIVFSELYNLEPQACQRVEILMSDMSHAFEEAFKNTISDRPIFVKCAFHVDERWRKNIKDTDLLFDVLELRNEGNINNFNHKLDQLMDLQINPVSQAARWPDPEVRRRGLDFLQYFFELYGPDGERAKTSQWARCYLKGTVSHNINLERQNYECKRYGLPCHRIDQQIENFDNIEKRDMIKENAVAKKLRNIKPSVAQVRHTKGHPEDAMAEHYLIQDLMNGEYIVTNEVNHHVWTVSPNNYPVCNPDKCLVICHLCGPGAICAHALICECPSFTRQNSCPHTHLVSLLLVNDPGKAKDQMEYRKVNIKKKRDYFKAKMTIANEKGDASTSSNQSLHRTSVVPRSSSVQGNESRPIGHRGRLQQPSMKDFARDLEADCLKAKEDCFETIGELRRAIERTENTQDGLDYLATLRLQAKALVQEGGAVSRRFNMERAHIPISKSKGWKKSRPGAPSKRHIPPRSFHIDTALPVMFASANCETNDFWPGLIAQRMDNINRYIASLNDEEERLEATDKLQTAIAFWTCKECLSFDLAMVNGGYISCQLCKRKFHRICVNMEVKFLQHNFDKIEYFHFKCQFSGSTKSGGKQLLEMC